MTMTTSEAKARRKAEQILSSLKTLYPKDRWACWDDSTINAIVITSDRGPMTCWIPLPACESVKEAKGMSTARPIGKTGDVAVEDGDVMDVTAAAMVTTVEDEEAKNRALGAKRLELLKRRQELRDEQQQLIEEIRLLQSQQDDERHDSTPSAPPPSLEPPCSLTMDRDGDSKLAVETHPEPREDVDEEEEEEGKRKGKGKGEGEGKKTETAEAAAMAEPTDDWLLQGMVSRCRTTKLFFEMNRLRTYFTRLKSKTKSEQKDGWLRFLARVRAEGVCDKELEELIDGLNIRWLLPANAVVASKEFMENVEEVEEEEEEEEKDDDEEKAEELSKTVEPCGKRLMDYVDKVRSKPKAEQEAEWNNFFGRISAIRMMSLGSMDCSVSEGGGDEEMAEEEKDDDEEKAEELSKMVEPYGKRAIHFHPKRLMDYVDKVRSKPKAEQEAEWDNFFGRISAEGHLNDAQVETLIEQMKPPPPPSPVRMLSLGSMDFSVSEGGGDEERPEEVEGAEAEETEEEEEEEEEEESMESKTARCLASLERWSETEERYTDEIHEGMRNRFFIDEEWDAIVRKLRLEYDDDESEDAEGATSTTTTSPPALDESEDGSKRLAMLQKWRQSLDLYTDEMIAEVRSRFADSKDWNAIATTLWTEYARKAEEAEKAKEAKEEENATMEGNENRCWSEREGDSVQTNLVTMSPISSVQTTNLPTMSPIESVSFSPGSPLPPSPPPRKTRKKSAEDDVGRKKLQYFREYNYVIMRERTGRFRIDIYNLSDDWLREFLGHFDPQDVSAQNAVRICGNILAVLSEYEVHFLMNNLSKSIQDEYDVWTMPIPDDYDYQRVLFSVPITSHNNPVAMLKSLGFEAEWKPTLRICVNALTEPWLKRLLQHTTHQTAHLYEGGLNVCHITLRQRPYDVAKPYELYVYFKTTDVSDAFCQTWNVVRCGRPPTTRVRRGNRVVTIVDA